jgi:hypothetical protein
VQVERSSALGGTNTQAFKKKYIIKPGEKGKRIFGLLIIEYELGKKGNSVTCILTLNTVLVGIRKLMKSALIYKFDVEVPNAKSNGMIELRLEKGAQISTLYGDFIYPGIDRQYTFKGTLIGWYQRVANHPGKEENDDIQQ